MVIKVVSWEDQKKRIARWPRKSLGLLAFLIGQHQAYRTKGFEYMGWYTKSGANRLARHMDRSGRNVLLIDTGQVTPTAKIPMFDVYRSFGKVAQ